MAQGGCCCYSKEGTVTIALLQLAADDPDSEVRCSAMEETRYLLDDVLVYINVPTVIDVNGVWGASDCRNTKPMFVGVIQYLNTVD